MTKAIRAFAVLLASLTGACADDDNLPVPETTEPEWIAPDALPVVLSNTDGAAMEALITGRLERQGPCIVLRMAQRPMTIIWGEEVSVERVGETGWAVRKTSTGELFEEGDWLQGGGGTYPEDADIAQLAKEAVPSPCLEGQAIQLHSIERALPPPDIPGLPDPPPPPPPTPEIMHSQPPEIDGAPDFPTTLVTGYDSPREALFSHVIGIYRKSEHFGSRPICLRDADKAIIGALAGAYGNLHPQSACGWRDGGVVFEATGEPALFVHAAIDCSGKSCAAQGGATYGNLGAESYGYRMRRTREGWTIQQTGIMSIS